MAPKPGDTEPPSTPQEVTTMANTVYVVLYKQNGDLEYKTADFADGLNGQENSLKSHRQVVGIFVKRIVSTQEFWDEFSGNSCYSLTESDEGIDVYPHDAGGQGITRVKHFANDGATAAIRQMDNKVASTVMGGGATWDTLEDGDGSLYNQKLVEAKAYLAANYNAPF